MKINFKMKKKNLIIAGVAVGISLSVAGIAIYKNISSSQNESVLSEAQADQEDTEIKDDELIVQTDDNGNTVIVDSDGNIVADSSKGDDIQSVIDKQKSDGKEVVAKDDSGNIQKVDKVNTDGTVVTSNGSTVKPEAVVTPTPQPEQQPTPAPQPEQQPTPAPQPEQVTYSYDAGASQELYSLLNSYRASCGLKAAGYSEQLAQQSKEQALICIKNFSAEHQCAQIGHVAGWNESANEVIQAFINSPDHRSVLQEDINKVGCAVYRSSNGHTASIITYRLNF